MIHDIGSVCTYCGVGCDITAQVQDNKILKIYAQSDGYVSQGKLCIKGKYGFDFVGSDERIRNVRIKKSFINKNYYKMPQELKARTRTLKNFDHHWFEADYEYATSVAAWKLEQIKAKYGRHSFYATGGARTSCESSFLLQKFARQTMESPNIDNCARVCHAPSLNGMAATIGEGAATNPYDDIYETEFMLIIGSNTTEAHPIVANRMIDAVRKYKTAEMIVCDVRQIQIGKFASEEVVLPYESNLLFLNSIAYVILKENLYNKEFIDARCKDFESYKEAILNDPYANPEIFKSIKGYEALADQVVTIARKLASKKSMIFWGLGITENIDGSYAVMAIVALALMTGNIGKVGAGLMPLRGQNNVQGTCDMGCLPYYGPDYTKPKEDGLKTPDAIDAMLKHKVKAMMVMGEDVAHIHPNQNKIEKALENLELLITQELFMTEIAKKSDIVFGVKSAYEKTGVYVNAMRRLHLSQPLIENDLPDDWQVIRDIENKIKGEFLFDSSEAVWEQVRIEAPFRYGGASYKKLEKHRSSGMQWPVGKVGTPRLHLEKFRTKDGFGYFKYNPYQLRGQVKKLIENGSYEKFYLTTGRVLIHYNNAAQTIQTPKLKEKHSEDILLVSIEDQHRIKSEKVILKTIHGETNPLTVKFSKTIKPGTIFSSFHHAKSNINYIFGDESDVNTKTALFKSLEVEIVEV
ncbi:MAG: molybdopterin-dependent oxidoreductase [Campylobacterales bacterium]|nr:molybdopterin-dependent oxidoreductase [Campylobacterales bacterium]